MSEHVNTSATDLRADAVRRYCEDLLLELRLEEVPGRRIGAVLAEVRDHLESSGEDPLEAFGTPRDYATALTAGAPAPARSARALEQVRQWAGNTAGVAALLCTLEGATALLSGRPGVLTEFQVLLPALAALAAPLLVGGIARARGLAVLGAGALMTLSIGAAALALARVGPLISVPVPAVALLVPGLLVGAGWIVATVRAVDPVVDPLQGAGTVRRQRRRGGLLLAALALLLLALPVVVLAVL